ncbi:MAG: xanthine dehydrogenase family protein molybdopterin-binding subunit [Burkholderiaceae bacterium]
MNAPFLPADAVARFGSGHAVRRLEDQSLLAGAGRFADDVSLPGQAHLMLLRSPYAHARLLNVDTAAAREMPGVLAVFTGEDLVAAGVRPLPGPGFKRPDGSPAASAPRRALAVDKVRYVGEAIAAVVAETREQARDALEAIGLDVEDLPAVVDPRAALADDAPRLSDAPDNLCARMSHGDRAATEAAFEAAAHVVALDLVNQRLAPSPIEPRAVVADFDPGTGRLTMHCATQMPTAVRNGLAQDTLGMPVEQVRVLVGDIGGGFGMKTGLYPEDVVVAFASRALQRPVKWLGERGDDFLAAVHGRDLISRAELALDADGKVLALRTRSLANVGGTAHPSGVAIQLLIGPWVSTSIYDIRTIDIEIDAVLTNMPPTGAYRGAGRPEAIYTIERLMDAAAHRLGLDPAEIRRRNMIRPDQFPYLNPMGQTYDTGNFEAILDEGLALSDWHGFDARLVESKRAGKLRGRGIATFLEWTGGNVFEESVSVTVSGDGYIEIFSATQAMGQGIVTSYAQLACDVFEVPLERIRILQGDTDRGNGFGSAGSRSLFTGGTAVRVASERTVDKARALAADELEVAPDDVEYDAGFYKVVGTDRRIDLFTVAARQQDARITLDARTSVEGPTWPNGCHVCEVEIDPATGQVEVVAYSSVNDVGRVVNPMIVRGQLDGGAVQGIGQALLEAVRYDADSGQALSASFLDYAMPRADIIRAFRTETNESAPCKNNPLGVKGVGELGTIGATPTVVNAVMDALIRAGRTDAPQRLQMPLTAERVWEILQD